MKNIFIIITLYIVSCSIHGQNYENIAQVISSAGGHSNSSNYLNFCVLCETFVNGNVQGGIFNSSIGFLYAIDGIPVSIIQNEVPIFNINIYPNPTKDYINIETKINDIYYIAIFNCLGIKVIEDITNNQIDLSEFANGIYLVCVKNKNGVLLKACRVIKND